MNEIKYSKIWCHDLENTIIFKLFEKESGKKFIQVKIDACDVLFIGPYDFNTIRRKALKKIVNKFNINLEKFKNLDLYKFDRKFNPLRIFVSHEPYVPELIHYDFSVTPHLAIDDNKHLRIPSWKDYIDWSNEGIFRDQGTLNSKRLGKFYNLEDFYKPLGNSFLKKPRKVCIFTSHLKEPRKSLFSLFQKNFEISGFGPYFDKTIMNHDSNTSTKIEIMKDFAFNLCPHQLLYPGFYDEKVPDSFFSNCLPITWADKNIDIDFNPRAFVNLLDYTKNSYESLFDKLKSDNFLEAFIDEPLCVGEINLEKETNFIKRVISNL